MIKTEAEILLEHIPSLIEFLDHIESEFEDNYFRVVYSSCSLV